MSLAELAGEAAADRTGEDETSAEISRRDFARLMGASLAFAGLTGVGCRRWEEEKILPLDQRPEGYVPGVAKQYATAFDLGGCATGLLVTSLDGRPIKVEGNPQHPDSGGGTTAFAQASILELYDPDRKATVTRRVNGKPVAAAWTDLVALIESLPLEVKFHVLAEASSSKTLAGLRSQRSIAGNNIPELVWHEYEPLSWDNQRAGTAIAFGTPLRPIHNLGQARTIVALDCDLLVDHPAAARNARELCAARAPEAATGESPRLYSVESCFSATGAFADHRLPLRSELILPFLLSLEATLAGSPGDILEAAGFLAEPHIARFRDILAAEIAADRGGSLLVAGYRQPPEVHALVARLNMPGVGRTLDYVPELDPDRPHHRDAISDLVTKIDAGEVEALLIIGGNPVYDAPADLDFAAALARVPHSFHLSCYQDETSAACGWHLPRSHYLESWGDAMSYDGTYSVVQPLIAPLYDSRTPIEVMNLLLASKTDPGELLVRKTFKGSDAEWQQGLHDGHVGSTRLPVIPPPPPAGGSEPRPALTLQLQEFSVSLATFHQIGGVELKNGQLEVVFLPSSHTYDGRFGNNSWLQETPDLMTRLTWENAALVSPGTAAALGIEQGEVVEIELGGHVAEIPAYVMPGQAPYSIGLPLGHGRTAAGRVGGSLADRVTPAGFDNYRLRTRDNLFFGSGARLRVTGRNYSLASVQDHWAIDPRGRRAVESRACSLIRSITRTEYSTLAAGETVTGCGRAHELPPAPLWQPPHVYAGHKWGMAIDLGKCTGCNACLLACQAENNVPVVGRAGVVKNREMSWLRLDRYFRGDPDNPTVVHQPVACMHCDNAPCEQVCPVGATIHTSEGINDMAYNRCVGTRYCMNNCPYRVRRFNYFDYASGLARDPTRKLAVNPQVSVRSRGVMEKCSFCVQRIERAKIAAKIAGRELGKGEIQTACQQACPTGAIVFGDLNLAGSPVSLLHASRRAYAMLGEFNTRPATLYLARVTNPNPQLVPTE